MGTWLSLSLSQLSHFAYYLDSVAAVLYRISPPSRSSRKTGTYCSMRYPPVQIDNFELLDFMSSHKTIWPWTKSSVFLCKVFFVICYSSSCARSFHKQIFVLVWKHDVPTGRSFCFFSLSLKKIVEKHQFHFSKR